MPPTRPPAKPAVSTSRELVPVGPREVFKKHPGRERDANGNKPLTARALVLRNGKYGAMGTGEVVLASRMSGREKLDLLAGEFSSRFVLFENRGRKNLKTDSRMTEDLMKQAIAAPFRLEVCLRIADSQLSGMVLVVL